MTSPRVKQLRHQNARLREQIRCLSELANVEGQAEKLNPHEQVQEEAIDLVSKLTGLSWMSHQRFRDVASAILNESSGALAVLEASGSLSDYREREW